MARSLLADINAKGVPCGCEYLDSLSPQWIGDLVSYVYIIIIYIT